MKKIKIAYVDFWQGFEPDTFQFTRILRNSFEVEITDQDPDFVFCSVFGNRFLQFSCPRILYTGEVFCPDFNLYDYAIGFDPILFEGRYLRYPHCLLNREGMEEALHKHERPQDYFLAKTKFCNFVVSAGGGLGDVRNDFFDRLSQYKRVDSGGKFRNNLPDGRAIADKRAFQEQYRFSIAFENTSFPGYVTEKLIDAWAAGTIPIYWGDPLAARDFNSKAFLYCEGPQDFGRVIEAVRELEEDRDKYLKMVKEPIVLPGSPMEEMLDPGYLERFLISVCVQEKEQALRRNSSKTMWGAFYEHRLRKWDRLENLPAVKAARKWKRKLFGLKKIV